MGSFFLFISDILKENEQLYAKGSEGGGSEA